MSISESVFFYHPAFWWLTSQIKNEREKACDDIAVDVCGSELKYAKSLVAVQEMSYYAPNLAMAFSNAKKGQQLLVRIDRLLNQQRSGIDIKDKAVAAFAILTIMLFVSIAARPKHEDTVCLPPTNEYMEDRSFYIRYNNGIGQDSFALPYIVHDGDYTYEDHVQQVYLTVKNNEVIKFSINGLNVPGKDIIRFEKLITEVILNDTQDNDFTSDNTFKVLTVDSSEFSTMKVYNGNDYKVKLTSDKKDKSVLELLSNDGTTIIYVLSDDKLTKNGKPAQKSELIPYNIDIVNGKFAFTDYDKVSGDNERNFIEEMCVQLQNDDLLSGNNSYVSISKQNMMVGSTLVNKTLHKKYIKLYKKHYKTASDEIYFHHNFIECADVPSPESEESNLDPINNLDSPQEHSGELDLSNENIINGIKFEKWLLQELIHDGYVTDRNNYHYYWDVNKMEVNKRFVTDSNRKKYMEQLKKITGEEVTKSFYKTKYVTSN